MKRVLILGLCIAAFIGSLRAQTNVPAAPERRELFIVETSRETKSSAAAQRDLISTLIASGMADLIADGDTIGIWTFNENVSIGQLPMQLWNKNSAQEIADRAAAFLKLQKYENKPLLAPILKPLSAVIRKSPVLTIVMVTSSRTPMVGTPYDVEIHSYFKEHEKEFNKKKIPFVTMFITQRGRIVRHTVGPGVGDVKIPKPLPEEPKPVVVVEPPKPQPPVEKRSTSALVITKGGAVKTSIEKAEEIATAANIVPTPVPVPPEPIGLPKKNIPNLPPGSVIVTDARDERYIVKGSTNAVLVEKNETPVAPAVPDVVVPDETTAVQIAEAVLTPVYGKAEIEAEKPLTAHLENEVWIIKGGASKRAMAEISKVDGRVVRVHPAR